jgi:hypothetical protein
MKRRVPRLTTDEEAEAFLESDLSDLDFSQFKSGRLRFEEAPQTKKPTISETYRLFEQAMIERKQIVCTYDGYRRELCPIILGHSKEEEKALTFQFGGEAKSGLPTGGEWKCFSLSEVSDVQLRDGPWHAGSRHGQKQTCVQIVDLDVNPDSPYNPKRQLSGIPRAARAQINGRTKKGSVRHSTGTKKLLLRTTGRK